MTAVIALVVVSLAIGTALGKCISKDDHGYKGGYGEKHQMMKSDMVEKLTGTWQSIDDAKSVVRYTEDGTMADIYDGEELGSGTWSMKQGHRKSAMLTTMMNGEEYTYQIEELTESELIMIYMPRGNVLRYNKITTGDRVLQN